MGFKEPCGVLGMKLGWVLVKQMPYQLYTIAPVPDIHFLYKERGAENREENDKIGLEEREGNLNGFQGTVGWLSEA